MARVYSLSFVALSLAMVGLAFFPFMEDRRMGEDGPAETLTAVFCLLGAYCCYRIFWMRKSILRKHHFLFLAGCLVFFFAGGEEISWGQRIFFPKPTPFQLGENLQREFNLHNLASLKTPIIVGGSLVMFLFAAVLPLLTYFSRRVKKAYVMLGLPLMPKSVCFGMWFGMLSLAVIPGILLKTKHISLMRFVWPTMPFNEYRELYFAFMLFMYLFVDYFHLLKFRSPYDSRP